MGIEIRESFPGTRTQCIDALAHEKGTQRDDDQKRQKRHRHRPAEVQQGTEYEARHEYRDQGRRHGVCKEELHQLHVMGRHGDQIAGAAAQQIGRCQFVEFLEERDAHFRQHAKRHVVGEPGFHPV